MRNAYISALHELARENSQVLSLVADNGAIVFDRFREELPGQFINFGIAEANMVTVAAGLASCGKTPFAYTIGAFLTMRAFEQVRNDMCLQQQNVKLVGVGGGITYGTLGPTHHATEDIGVMRVLPNMTIIVPASPLEARKATFAAAEINGPVYLRLEATKEPEIYEGDYDFCAGRGVTLLEGDDITLISAGSIVYDVLLAGRELQNKGISARIINMHTIKPVDRDILVKAARETGAVLTVEEHNIIGGLGSAVAEVLLEEAGTPLIFARMGLLDRFCRGYANHGELRAMNGLSKEHMVEKAIELHSRKPTR